ncbi:hypothetical protein [Endozoicomonas numazuensis]|uniref:DUF2357 domain-containing protein n=1 Tax=Endozoicomonas numazuensis TaxID=1137799 RepID=A0A081NHG5_9GAMM|nr:hypothetical protein [Endozoicomonas numazuensis]KEQ17888.1 hypothetical protein GZ78_09620 [Endozoicomonas numazuensis]
MRVLDRMTGQQLVLNQLPDALTPGRYVALDTLHANNHSEITPGTFIVSDGSEQLSLNGRGFSVNDDSANKTDKDSGYWMKKAIIQIAGHIRTLEINDTEELPTPLLPSSIIDIQYDKLLDLLDTALNKGHLHSISIRPRIDMKYDSQLMPVSRARKVASNANRHLAAHSECWQKRTLTGVMPKQILGLVSEDEYNLYENQVYARLLDNLQTYLTVRLNDLRALELDLNEFEKIEKSEELYHKLISDICELWGKTFSVDETEEILKTLRSQISTIEAYLRKIKGLKQRGLYKQVPRSARVPSQIHVTNILAHDQHYRHLVGLWQTLIEVMSSSNLPASEVMNANIELQESYMDYCKLVIIRSLKALGFRLKSASEEIFNFERGRQEVLLKKESYQWLVQSELASLDLHFTPISCRDGHDLQATIDNNKVVIPCIPGKGQQKHPNTWLSGGNRDPLFISPEDFYLEERMVVLLKTWLWSGVMQSYGLAIDKLCRPFVQYAESETSLFRISGSSSIKVIAPLSPKKQTELHQALQDTGLSADLQKAVKQSVQYVNFLSSCPDCGSKGEFTPWERDCFKCDCSSCGNQWSISYTKGHRIGKFTANKSNEPGFDQNGRWNYSFNLSELSSP